MSSYPGGPGFPFPPRRQSGGFIMGLFVFIAGAAAGWAAGRYPNEILRATVKTGLKVGSKLRELQEEIAEDIDDEVAAARAETISSTKH